MSPRRRLPALLLVAVASLGACSSSSDSASGSASSTTTTVATTTTTAPDLDVRYPVGSLTDTVVDTSRVTNASGGAPERPERTIPFRVLYPAAEGVEAEVVDGAPPAPGRFPVIVFSHGFTASGNAYVPFARFVAAEGYVVALPTFPLSSGGRETPPDLGDYTNQPADVSFVLGQLERLLPDTVDLDLAAAAGHSLGAITTLGVAYDPCCEDDRFDAFVSVAGWQLPFTDDGEATFTNEAPLLLIHSDADGTVPYSASVDVFERAPGPRAFVTLHGAPHTPDTPELVELIVDVTVDFLDAELLGRTESLDRLTEDANVEGVASLQTAGL